MSGDVRWRKSSRSSSQGGNCVEVGQLSVAEWRKSARSGGQGGDCVEVAGLGCACEGHSRVIAVRDSKDPEGPMLAFGAGEWRGFFGRIKAGLDLR